MWQSRRINTQYGRRFFRISLCHNTLENYFITNFNMMQHHKYSLTELDNLMPFEKEIYINLLVNHIKEENEKIKDQQAQSRR